MNDDDGDGTGGGDGDGDAGQDGRWSHKQIAYEHVTHAICLYAWIY